MLEVSDMLRTTTASLLLWAALPLVAAPPPPRPVVTTAADGYPTGQSSPEGVASDFARSIIEGDMPLLRRICISRLGSELAEFIDGMAATIEQKASERQPPPDKPKAIRKVFVARHLSRNGPASYGYAAHGFREVMFVDVVVLLQGGQTELCRTLVVQDKNGDWYVHPAPHLSPLLSMGLNDESPSTIVLPTVHESQR